MADRRRKLYSSPERKAEWERRKSIVKINPGRVFQSVVNQFAKALHK